MESNIPLEPTLPGCACNSFGAVDSSRDLRVPMSAMQNLNPIRVGLVAGEPIQLEGLTCMFEQAHQNGQATLWSRSSAVSQELLREPFGGLPRRRSQLTPRTP